MIKGPWLEEKTSDAGRSRPHLPAGLLPRSLDHAPTEQSPLILNLVSWCLVWIFIFRLSEPNDLEWHLQKRKNKPTRRITENDKTKPNNSMNTRGLSGTIA